MAWRAANSLLVLHRQLKAGAPRAAPPATDDDAWGLIGDAAHDPNSDHTPHDFPGWGNDIVTAADFPNAPALGLDAHKVLDDIRRAQDKRAKYGISNGQIFSNHAVDGYAAWTWRPYNPKNGDKHFTHGHLSVVGDARADGTQPWPTIGGDMEQSEQVKGNLSKGNTVGDTLADLGNERDWWYLPPSATSKNPPPAGSRADLVFKAAQQVLADKPTPVTMTDADRDAIADKVAAKLAEVRFVAETPAP